MVMREVVRGTEESCREKALAHIKRVQSRFDETTSEEDKFHAYLDLFNKTAYGVSRCRENFEGDHYQRWLANKETAMILVEGNREGVILLEMATAEMEKLPLSRVNGTSVEFTKCALLCRKSQEDYIDTDRVLHEKVLCDQPSEPVIFMRKLEVAMVSFLTPLLFLQDSVLA